MYHPRLLSHNIFQLCFVFPLVLVIKSLVQERTYITIHTANLSASGTEAFDFNLDYFHFIFNNLLAGKAEKIPVRACKLVILTN